MSGSLAGAVQRPRGGNHVDMADLVIGPLLRYVSGTEATVWVETTAPCVAEVLGEREPTFSVEGHHYALVRIEGLEPGSITEYEVRLDGERRWPPPGSQFPPSTIKTIAPESAFDLAYGSCRLALPHREPYTLSKDEHPEGREFDALYVLAREMLNSDRDEWPEILLLLGDQVYVDEGSPEARRRIRERRSIDGPLNDEVSDFEEYTWLYRESWGDPHIRWLFSTVSTSMVWDDHDIHDDWNISRSWVEDMEREPWWHERLRGGFMSYWIYQHLGNLSPRELDSNELYQRVRGPGDATAAMHAWVSEVGSTGEGTRWCYCRDLNRARLIVMDDRAGRVLDEGHRSIFNKEEWDWVSDQARGDYDHLLLATTDPYLLVPALHYLEAWGESVCAGAWGGLAAKAGEKLRRRFDFDHWAAFQYSFQRLRELLEELGSGRRGKPPASILLLSGDVHHAYLAEIAFPARSRVRSAVYQGVCSPLRNSLDEHEQRAVKLSLTRPAIALTRGLARSAGAPDPGIRWRLREGPFFDNQLGSVRVDGRSLEIRLDKTIPGERDEQRLECVYRHRLV